MPPRKFRRNEEWLRDILESLDAVGRFAAGKTFADFLGSELLMDGIVRRLSIVGEAASRLDQELRARHPEVPWQQVIAFRNFLVHDYFGIHWAIVWEAATREAPVLRRQVAAVYRAEFPGATDTP